MLDGKPGRAEPVRVFAVLMLLLVSCVAPGEEPARRAPSLPWFEEVGSRAGLDFTHISGHDGKQYLLPESAAGGGALFDMDNDGDLDIYLVQSFNSGNEDPTRTGNRLFENVGPNQASSEEWSFVDVTAKTGAGDPGYGMGVATGDYDNDGDLDLYVTNVGSNVLLRNDRDEDGQVVFTDVSVEARVADPSFGSSAAFVDYDLDGDLDLFVVNYVVWSPALERECRNRIGERDYCDPMEYDAPAPDVLLHNEGPGPDGVVRFRDVSVEAGVRTRHGNGLGVSVADFNGDQLPDIFVANDRMADHLWINQGQQQSGVGFLEQASIFGCAIDDDGVAKAGMGTEAVDVDNDGDPDLLVGNFKDESDSFYRNEGAYFVDSTPGYGLKTVSRPFTRFGLGLVDFNNDGLLDLFQATGRVSRQERWFGNDPYAEPNLLFTGISDEAGKLGFREVVPRGGTELELFSAARAAAFGDIDNDGRVDILVVNRDQRAHLLHNVTKESGRWVSFRALNQHGSDAIGAVVSFEVQGQRIWRSVRTAHSYLAASDPRVHSGLAANDQLANVTVLWPNGVVEKFGDFEAGRVWQLKQGAGNLD